MKKQLSMRGIKAPMSREEMKNVFAGKIILPPDSEGGGGCLDRCKSDSDCNKNCGVCKIYYSGQYCFSS